MVNGRRVALPYIGPIPSNRAGARSRRTQKPTLYPALAAALQPLQTDPDVEMNLDAAR
jgi:hypothetical protein